VDRDGNALFPMMPYEGYGRLSDEDVQAVVAYLDSLPPIHNPLPKTKLVFPVSLLIKSAPRPVGKVAAIDKSDPKKYGEFLVAVGGCGGCHTPMDKGQPLSGKLLAGGRLFDTPMGKVVSANITTDIDTGIGKWREEFFLQKFYEYKEYATNGPPPLSGPQSFTLMPWLGFSRKTEDELKAIYAYLRTVPSVHNAVETHPGFPNPPAIQ